MTGVMSSGMLLAAGESVSAQDPSSAAAAVKRAITVHDSVIVMTTDGRRLAGTVEGLTDAALTLRTPTETTTVSFERLSEIRVRRQDPLWNGMLIGTGIGALGGLIPDYYDDCEECHDALYGSMALGAGIGLVVDVLMPSTRLVYQSPARERKGSAPRLTADRSRRSR